MTLRPFSFRRRWLWSGVLGILLANAPARAAAPKLIVILVGDQIRADYLERYHGYLVAGGLRRFRDEGTYFTKALMDDGVTKTSPGHVLIGSGLYAEKSGIIANDWFDRTSGHSVSAAETLAGSPRTRLKWFVGKSFAEHVHEALPESRIVSVSLKDRGALLLTGPDQNEAYWWDRKKKEWTSYHDASSWLLHMNLAQPAFVSENTVWRPLFTLDEESKAAFKDHTQLPHSLSTVDEVMSSPFADEWTEILAEHAFDEWHLGESSSTDVLTVSFSAVDLVGHKYGPDSQEVMDAFLRLDRQIAKLMEHIENHVGDPVVWAFSSDHGVTPLPEESKAHGLPAYRVSFTKASLPHPSWISGVSDPWVYLDRSAIQKAGVSPDKALAQMKKDLLEIPGVSSVYTPEDIQKKIAPPEVLRSFFPNRCGDLWVVLKPKSIFSDSPSGTTHGQPTPDDQHIPLGFYGKDVDGRVVMENASVSLLAPTLLHLMNIPAPDLASPFPLSE